MTYWLVKTEEDVYPIDALKTDKETSWDGVRNYQARNFLTSMKKGDLVFIYHSNAKVPGISGLAEVKKVAEPDVLQFDKKSDYFDPAATPENPRWFAPTLKFKQKFPEILSLEQIKSIKALGNSKLLQKGNRLSVLPISDQEAEAIFSYFK